MISPTALLNMARRVADSPKESAATGIVIVALASVDACSGLTVDQLRDATGLSKRAYYLATNALLTAGLIHRSRIGHNGVSVVVLSDAARAELGFSAPVVDAPAPAPAPAASAEDELNAFVIQMLEAAVEQIQAEPTRTPLAVIFDCDHHVVSSLEDEAMVFAWRHAVLRLAADATLSSLKPADDITAFQTLGCRSDRAFNAALETIDSMQGSTPSKSWGAYLRGGLSKRLSGVKAGAR